MSDFESRPINPTPARDFSQLPVTLSPGPQMMGTPLPAAPWIESQENKGGFNFVGFLHSLRRRWLLGLGVGSLLASTLAALLWLLVPVKYEAQVQIRIRRNPEEIFRDKISRPQLPQDYEITKQTQAALIKSPFVIQAALRQRGISQMPLVRDEPWFGERDNPVAWLEKQLKVEFAQGSEFLRLTMKERHAEDLKRLLDAVTDAYMTEVVQADLINQRQKYEKLKDRYRTLQREIAGQWDQIIELSKTYGSTESEAVKMRIEIGYRELAELSREKQLVDQQFFEAYDLFEEHRRRMMAAQMYQPKDFEVEDVLLQYPEYRVMKEQQMQLEQAINFGQGQGRGPAGGAGVLQGQLAQIAQQMDEFRYLKKGEAVQRLKLMTENDDTAMQQEYEIQEHRLKMLDNRRNQIHEQHKLLSERMLGEGAANSDLMVRQSQLESDQDSMDRIKQEIETLELEMSSKPQIEVLEKAIIPDESNWIMKYLQIIAAWGLALTGTVLGIALWDMQHQRVNNSQEVIETGDVRVIGTLPLLSSRWAGGLLPLPQSSRRTLEMSLTRSIDSIRTALLFAKRQHPYQVIMVTSALGQEGKTTVASQLAVSFARSGRRTLLIDGDIRNPQQHVVLGMPMSHGLCEILRSEVSLDDALKATPAEGLWCLCAGRRDYDTDQYLASAVVGKLFQELRSRFDLIVIDTGPALTSPDAMLLGQFADATVISVRRDVSRLPKVTEACDRLRSVGVNIAGAILNGADSDIRESDMKLAIQPAGPQLEKV